MTALGTPIVLGVIVIAMIVVAGVAGYESGSKVPQTVTTTTTQVMTTTTTAANPINVVSAEVVPLTAGNDSGDVPPGATYWSGAGPTVELTLQNEAGYPLISLSATLLNVEVVGGYRNLTYQFNLDSSHPLGQGQTVNANQTIVGGMLGSIPYPLVIEGTIQGQNTSFTETVMIQING